MNKYFNIIKNQVNKYIIFYYNYKSNLFFLNSFPKNCDFINGKIYYHKN